MDNNNMNEKQLLNTFKLLQIKEITSERQKKQGTKVFKLPMRAYWHNGQSSEPVILATYKSGYVRRLLTNSGCYGGASMYQLNKRVDAEPEYYKDYKCEWKDGEYTQEWTGKYNKYVSRICKLIPKEIDRLQYLLNYAIKNWYCKPQIQTKEVIKEVKSPQDIAITIDGHRYTVQEGNKLD